MGTFDEHYDRALDELKKIETNFKVKETKDNIGKKIPQKIELPTFILEVNEARWISARFYEDVERGIYSVNLVVKKSPNCVELTPVITIAENVGYAVVSGTVMFLLKELKDYLMRNKRRKEKLKKEREQF